MNIKLLKFLTHFIIFLLADFTLSSGWAYPKNPYRIGPKGGAQNHRAQAPQTTKQAITN